MPDNDKIQIDMGKFPAAMKVRWYRTTSGTYQNGPKLTTNRGIHTFNKPNKWQDAVLLLEKVEMRGLHSKLHISREPLNLYGSLEEMIRRLREHRPLDLNAEIWRQAHPGGTFEEWRAQAHSCLMDGLHYNPGPLNLNSEVVQPRETRRVRPGARGVQYNALDSGQRIFPSSDRRRVSSSRPRGLSRLGRSYAVWERPYCQLRPRSSSPRRTS